MKSGAKFNSKELSILRYNNIFRGFAELEEELHLSGQLKVIQKKKEKLQNELNDLCKVDCKNEIAVEKVDDTDNRNESSENHDFPTIVDDDEDLKDSVSEKELMKANVVSSTTVRQCPRKI